MTARCLTWLNSTELQINNDQFHQELVKMIQLMHSIGISSGSEGELEQAMRKRPSFQVAAT